MNNTSHYLSIYITFNVVEHLQYKLLPYSTYNQTAACHVTVKPQKQVGIQPISASCTAQCRECCLVLFFVLPGLLFWFQSFPTLLSLVYFPNVYTCSVFSH